MTYCNERDCYNRIYDDSALCSNCEKHGENKKPFAEGMNEAFQTMEERMVALEADVKRLKRELGLK